MNWRSAKWLRVNQHDIIADALASDEPEKALRLGFDLPHSDRWGFRFRDDSGNRMAAERSYVEDVCTITSYYPAKELWINRNMQLVGSCPKRICHYCHKTIFPVGWRAHIKTVSHRNKIANVFLDFDLPTDIERLIVSFMVETKKRTRKRANPWGL